MRFLIMICLLAAICAGSDRLNASSNTLSGASASIMVTATVNAPLGVFIDKGGELKLQAPNNSGVFVERNDRTGQAVVFVTMRAESHRAGFSPRIATKPVSNIFDNAILDNRIFDAGSTLSYGSLAGSIPILTIIYTEN